MTPYWNGLGNELGAGLSAFAQQLIGTQNTLKQQDEAKQQRDLDNAYRQQAFNESVRQYDDTAKRTRDTQAFQWLGGQQQQLMTILSKGGFAKGSPEYMAAESALKDTNGLMRRVLNGETLSPEEMERYDTVLANVAAITGQGAATVGERVTAQDNAGLAATQAGTTATVDANARANELQPFSVAQAGYQNTILGAQAANAPTLYGAQARTATVAATVAEGTQDAQIARAGLENQSLQIGIDTARWQLGDLQAKAPLVYEGMSLANKTAQQLLDFNEAANPERLAGFQLQNQQTRQQIEQSADLFPHQKALLIAQVDVQEAQAEIAEATKQGVIDGTNSQNWQLIAQAGNPALFDKYVKDGLLTPQQAAPYKRLAEAYARQRAAQTATAEANATTAASQSRVQTGTEQAQIQTGQAQAQTAAAQATTAQSQARVQTGTEQAQIQTGQAQARTATAQAATTESGARVAAATEGAAISTANSNASTAASQAQSAAAQAAVDVATIPTMIKARQVSVQQAQAALAAQLTENRFADATFAARVKAVDIQTSQGLQQLLLMRQQYNQNAQKFPKELEYLDAQIAVQQAAAKEAAASALAADGNGVTDPKLMMKSLEQMRIINGQNIRVAQANLKALIARYLPNAKFSVDQWDKTKYTTLMANIKNLPAEAQQDIQNAAASLDMYQSESKDLSTAFAQVGSKGRIDPKVAERLGIFSPDDEGPGGGNFIQGPSTPPTKAPKARNVPAGIVSGEGGVVYAGGGAKAVQSLLPQSEITKQIVMTTDHYLGKIKQQGGYSNPWDNTAGPVRAYNGMGPTMDVQKRYVNDIRATYDAKPWMQAISDATGARKTELQYINAEAERIAKQRGVDPDIIKAIMWNESMGWQPGIPSSDGKGGGLGQVTGYFPPKGASYSLAPGNVRTVGGTTGPQKPAPAPTTKPAPATSTKPAPTKFPPLGGVALTTPAVTALGNAFKAINAEKDPAKQRAKGTQVIQALIPQLTKILGKPVTAEQVFVWLQQNGGRL